MGRWDRTTPLQRFAAKVGPIEPGGCWPWIGAKSGTGYGVVSFRGRQEMAHRVAYVLSRGPIEPGLVIDHLCRNPACVNPHHLEAVTQVENVRRGEGHGSETHCPAGHPYDEANTTRGPRGERRCLACHRDRERRRRAVYTHVILED